MKKHRIAINILIVFMISTLLMILGVSYYVMERKEYTVEKVNYLLDSQVSELERSLSSYIQACDTLRILVVNSQGNVKDFEKVAKELYNNDPAYRSIQLAPNGNVQYVYPLEGNEEAFGDLFADPERKNEAEYARDSGETILAGPFELYQGGLGIVIREPIYLNANDKKSFWGFSVIVLNIPEIFDQEHLKGLEKIGYNFQLWRTHPDTGEKQIIISSKNQNLISPIEKKFTVPGASWTFSISPQNGWINWDDSKPTIIAMICIDILVCILCYLIMRINRQKRMMEDISNHDYLTNLYNLRKMYQILGEKCNHLSSFYLIYIDVDKFKEVNDAYGHATGDILLKTIAQRLQVFSKENYAFRIGGDEFALIIDGEEDIETILGSLKLLLKKELHLQKDVLYYPELSMGYVSYPDEVHTIEDIMNTADQKMYDMKRKSVMKKKSI